MRGTHDVITIGTATRDAFLSVPKEKICFEPGVKKDVSSMVFAVGGGAANAAVTFARQGLAVGAIFRVGDDESGDAVVRELGREGVDCWVSRDHDTATGFSAIMLHEGGERTVFAYRGAAEDMPEAAVPVGKLKAKWLYIVPSRIDFEVIAKIVAHAHKKGIAIAMNPSGYYLENRGARLKPLLPKLAMLMVNRGEAAALTGMPPEDASGIFRRLDGLMGGIAIMTDGPKGAWVSDGRHMYRAGIFPNKKVVDRTGAGDAFGSGFVVGMIAKGDIPYALRLASANAAANVERIGAHQGMLTKSEFERAARWKKLHITCHEL